MGGLYSRPCEIPTASEARQIVKSETEKRYTRYFNQCTHEIRKDINYGRSCSYCEYIGLKYEKQLEEMGYDIDKWSAGTLVSWKQKN